MAKWCNDDMLDAALNYLKTNVDRIVLCSAQPTTYNEATITYALADVTVDTDDFTLANGDASGRKLTVGAQSSITVDANGTGTHLALVKTGDTTLRYVNTCNAQAVAIGNPFNLPAWDIEIADPAAA